MAKFFIGLVTGVLIVFLSIVALFFVLLRFREKPPAIADNSVLVMRLSGEIPEKPPVDLPDFLPGNHATTTIASIWMNLKKAAADPHIRAAVIEPEGVSVGWARMEEIRNDIEQFRQSGKPVYAFLRNPSARDYYIALGASRIYLGPQEPLMLKGLRAELTYFKKTLDKIGVTVEVEHAGKYKDFGDMFTRSDMSPETKEVITSVVDDLYGGMLEKIAAARKKSPDDVRAMIDRGPFTASQALSEGLVDELRFEDQMFGELKDAIKAEPVKVPLERYAKTEDSSAKGKSRIALVIGEGDIVRGDPSDNGQDESSLTSYGFNKLLQQVAKDSTIKGAIVRINSPGGEVSASDEIWRQMGLLSKQKPLVISMSDLAASGGYYMAMTGDPIVAYPQTETGSIGVVFGKPVLHGLYDKLGLSKDAIQRGAHADIDSEYTPLTPDERELLKRGIDESYRDFVTKVATARHRPYGEIEPSAQGRVWLGSQALQRNLVDSLGGLDQAVAALKQKAKIPASEQVNVVVYPAKRSLIEVLMRRQQDDVMESKLREVFGSVPFHAWTRGGYLRVMPYWLTVR